MTLTAPDVTWLITLGDFAGFSILPEHAFGSIPPDQLQKASFSFAPGPGAGAFTFGEYLADQYVSLNRNDTYQPPKANIDQLYLPILPQTVTALSQLQNGELDIAQVPIPDLASVQDNPDLTVSSEPSVMMQFLVPNMTRPEFADKRVRQAMIYALDRAAIVKEIMLDKATVINSCFFGWEWEDGEPEGLNPYAYDPDMAKATAPGGGLGQQHHHRVPLHPGQPAGGVAAQHLRPAIQRRRHQRRAASRSTYPTTPTASSAAPQAAKPATSSS